jgi:acyl carrier protein
MTTLRRTQRLIARRLEIDERELAPGRQLQDLGIDSLAVLELLFDLEEEFGIRLPHEHARVATLGDVVVLVDRELAGEVS